MISIERLPEFDKDLKALSKKYRTVHEDLDVLEKVLQVNPGANPGVNPGANPPFSYRIDGSGITSCVIKVKKIASKSFKGKGVNSGFRLIYAHFEEEQRIVYIELYHKNDKPLEDKERILKQFR